MKMFFIQDTTGRGFTSEMSEYDLTNFALEASDDADELRDFADGCEVGDSIRLQSEGCRITRTADQPVLLDAIKFLSSSFGESRPLSEFTTDWYLFDECKYKVKRHNNGDFSCVVGNREVRSRNPFKVVAELLEFIQTGEEK